MSKEDSAAASGDTRPATRQRKAAYAFALYFAWIERCLRDNRKWLPREKTALRKPENFSKGCVPPLEQWLVWSGTGEESFCLPILFASASSPFSSPGDPKALQTNAVTGFRSLVLASTRQLNQQPSVRTRLFSFRHWKAEPTMLKTLRLIQVRTFIEDRPTSRRSVPPSSHGRNKIVFDLRNK